MKRELKVHGKLLLTGEYAVLEGAKAFAIPLQYGQRMTISGGRGCDISWEAYDEKQKEWFNARISLYDFKALKTTDEKVSDKLTHILNNAVNLNSDFLSTWKGMKVKTNLDFPRHYGWGTSSTLITLIAQWAEIEPFDLMREVSQGSGYDIICATASGPLLFQLEDQQPLHTEIDWEPQYISNLYLIYQGKKKNSEEAIKSYFNQKSSDTWISRINNLTEQFVTASDLKTLDNVIEEHENLLAERLATTRLKTQFFPDYWGEIKSLGAWGGDFALVTSDRNMTETKSYFSQKDFNTFLSLQSVLLRNKRELTGS